jgi:hypothetical protein
MKFENAILEKKVKREDLPKGVQKKISDVEKLAAKLTDMESVEMDESEKQDFEEAKNRLDYLDTQIEKAIYLFDPVVYQERLARLNKMVSAKGKKPEADADGGVVKTLKKEDDAIVDTINGDKTKNEKIQEDLDRLKKTVKVKPEMIEDEITPTEEVEEFEKSGDAQPKKMSKGLILMGVGAFLLTWGAVNFFRERRAI